MRKFIPIIVFIVLIAGTAFGVHLAAANYIAKSAAADAKSAAVTCTKTGLNHLVLIHDNQLSATDTAGKLCDTLTITNQDNRLRLMAFGQHDHHTPYDGITEKILAQNQSLTVTLDQTGTFTFHDHIDDSVVGYFTVSQ